MEYNIIGLIKSPQKGITRVDTDKILQAIQTHIDPDATYSNLSFRFKYRDEMHTVFCDNELSEGWNWKRVPDQAKVLCLMSGATQKNGSVYAEAIKSIVSLFGGWFIDVEDQTTTIVEKLQ